MTTRPPEGGQHHNHTCILSVVADTHWGCTQSDDRRLPRHLVDQERSAHRGDPVALCGTELYYVDNEMTVRPGDPCSGRQMVMERDRDCRRCLRRDADRATMVLIPATAVASLASAAPSLWHKMVPTLSVNVVSTVNATMANGL